MRDHERVHVGRDERVDFHNAALRPAMEYAFEYVTEFALPLFVLAVHDEMTCTFAAVSGECDEMDHESHG